MCVHAHAVEIQTEIHFKGNMSDLIGESELESNFISPSPFGRSIIKPCRGALDKGKNREQINWKLMKFVASDGIGIGHVNY